MNNSKTLPIGHTFYVNIRALVLGGTIAYGFWYVIYHASTFVYVVGLLVALVIIGTLWTTRTTFTKFYRLNYLALPILLLSSSLFFFLLLKNPTFQLLFVIMIGVIFTFLFRAYAELREHPTPERKKSITQFLDIATAVLVFLSFASLQQLYFFFSLKIYWIVLIGLILSGILLYQIYWYHRLITFKAWFYVLLGGLLMAQALWVITLLPTGYLTNAIVAVSFFYVYQAITVSSLRSLLRPRITLEYLGIASALLLIAFVSSPWTPLG